MDVLDGLFCTLDAMTPPLIPLCDAGILIQNATAAPAELYVSGRVKQGEVWVPKCIHCFFE